MARRRVGHAVGAGIGAGLSSLGQQLQEIAAKRMENDLIMERQRELSKLNQTEALERAREERKGKLAEMALSNPSLARRVRATGLDKALGLTIPDQTPEDILGPEYAAIAGAKTEEELNAPEAIQGAIEARGGLAIDTPDVGPIETPRPGQTAMRPSQINQLLAARQARQDQLRELAMGKPADITSMSPEGVKTITPSTVGARQRAGVLPQERTTKQEAGRAGATQFAQTAASEAAQSTPAAIEGAGKRAGAVAAAQAAFAPATESQSTAAGYLPLLLSADKQAKAMEQRGVKLELGTQTLGRIPGGPKLLSEDQTLYLNMAGNFISLATRILSGVAARPDEIQTYTSNLFSVAGESPKLVVQKQKFREAFIQAVRAKAARGERFATSAEALQAVMDEATAAAGGQAQPGVDLLQRFRTEQGGR